MDWYLLQRLRYNLRRRRQQWQPAHVSGDFFRRAGCGKSARMIRCAAARRKHPDADGAEITFQVGSHPFGARIGASGLWKGVMSPADAFDILRSALEQAGKH